MFIKPWKYAVNCIFVAYVFQTGLFFFLLFLGYPYGGKHAARRELSMPFFLNLKYAFCMAILWFGFGHTET